MQGCGNNNATFLKQRRNEFLYKYKYVEIICVCVYIIISTGTKIKQITLDGYIQGIADVGEDAMKWERGWKSKQGG